jgi:hypothetical protein
VLVHVDTEQAYDQLINSRLAYVSISRGRFDAQIYTNDAGELGEELNRNVSKQSALETGHEISNGDRVHTTGNPIHQSVGQPQATAKGTAWSVDLHAGFDPSRVCMTVVEYLKTT